MTAAEPLSLTGLELTVRVGDGVRGLSRVVNVLALLDVAPAALSATSAAEVVTITMALPAKALPARDRAVRLALERLRALPCVLSVRLSPRGDEATAPLAALADY